MAKNGGVGLKLGLDGIGVQYVYGINPYVGVRAGYQFGSYTYNDKKDGTDYDAKLKINALAGFVDVMPFGGGFRISAGLYGKSPGVTLNASGEDQYELGDSTYNGDLRLHGHTDLGKTSPYLGLGWGGTANKTGFGMSFDAGVIFGKSPKLSLLASGVACDASVDSACDPHGPSGFDVTTNPDFQASLEQERQDMEHDAKDFRYWPVLNLGVHYRF